jgi:hypothetical protein
VFYVVVLDSGMGGEEQKPLTKVATLGTVKKAVKS